MWSPLWTVLAVTTVVALLCFYEYSGIAAAYEPGGFGPVGYGAGLLILMLPPGDTYLAITVVAVALMALAMALRAGELRSGIIRAAFLRLAWCTCSDAGVLHRCYRRRTATGFFTLWC